MESNPATSSIRNAVLGLMPLTWTWQMANPNVDNAAPPPSKKKAAKKAPSNKSGKKR